MSPRLSFRKSIKHCQPGGLLNRHTKTMTRKTHTSTQDRAEDKRGKHAKTGLPYWQRKAPATASLAEILEAYEEYDSPEEAWPAGDNHTLFDFAGETA